MCVVALAFRYTRIRDDDKSSSDTAGRSVSRAIPLLLPLPVLGGRDALFSPTVYAVIARDLGGRDLCAESNGSSDSWKLYTWSIALAEPFVT